MKKTAFTAILTSALLLSAAAGISVVSLAKANPFGWYNIEASESPSIRIDSPLNETYDYNGRVLFNFTISPSENWSPQYERVNSLNYSVDGELAKTIIVNSSLSYYPYRQNGKFLVKPFSYSTFLENFTDGNHVVRISVKYTGYFYRQSWAIVTEGHPEMVRSAMVSFTMDTVSPAMKILSVENKTYHESDLQLDFAVNEDFCNAFYVLDGLNVPVAGNLTLSGLPVGNHSLTVFAYDMAGNFGASNTIAFAVEPFPTTLLIVSAIVVAVIIGIGLSVYFKKPKGVKKP
jgi:hypothetical protein